MIKHIQDYVSAVANNIDFSLENPIDIVISGGAFNGAYGLGAVLVIKELEKQKKIRIERVSGCSVGGVLALLYFTDIGSELESLFIEFKECLKNDGCMHILGDVITNIVDKAFTEDDVKLLSGRLFLTCTDLVTMNTIVTSEYKNKADLVNALHRSSFIPLMINGKDSFEDRYIDGILPYLFKDGKRDSLYVNLIEYSTIFSALITRNEQNPHYRIMQGTNDVFQFFVDGNSRMCSWVSKWGITQYSIQNAIFMISIIISLFIRYVSRLEIPSVITCQPVIKLIISTCKRMRRDIIYVLSS